MMTPEDFKMWRAGMSLTMAEAAEALGLSVGSIVNYERGVRRDDGRSVQIPKTVGLACAALAAGLEEWKNPITI